MSRYDLTDFEWRVIEPLLPNKPRGVPRVEDRRVLNGIFWVLRSGAPWRDLPERYGPRTTCYNRFVRWRRAGVWDRLMDAITAAYDGDIQMIDSTSIRAHQQAATAKRGVEITVLTCSPEIRPVLNWAHREEMSDAAKPFYRRANHWRAA
jgi:transposase